MHKWNKRIYIGHSLIVIMENVKKEIQASTSSKVEEVKPSLASLIEQAKKVGHSEVPTGTTELEETIQAIFDNSGKIMSAKEVFGIIKQRDAKYYSDKLWYMRKAGKLVVKARGFYQSAKVAKGQ